MSDQPVVPVPPSELPDSAVVFTSLRNEAEAGEAILRWRGDTEHFDRSHGLEGSHGLVRG